MNLVFGDALYWIGSILPSDTWHRAALLAASKLEEGARLVTTEEVLTEVLSAFSGRGAHLRSQAASVVRSLMAADTMTVLPQSHDSFLSGLSLYENRSDKAYSLVDCISMNTMRELGIVDILTNDHHFTQEGFRILITNP